MNLLTKQEIEDVRSVAAWDSEDCGMAVAARYARTTLALMTQLEDAEAAQALLVERAAGHVGQALDALTSGSFDTSDPRIEALAEYADAIRALAPASGVAALAELRAERDEWKRKHGELQDLATEHNTAVAKNTIALTSRAQKAEAERDDALARLAAAEKRSKENWTRVRRLWDLAKGWDPDDGEEGPFCRDCADEDGRCPNSGFPCDPQAEAEERISQALTRLAAAEAREGALREAWRNWHKASVERSAIAVCGPASAAEYQRLSDLMNGAADVFNALAPAQGVVLAVSAPSSADDHRAALDLISGSSSISSEAAAGDPDGVRSLLPHADGPDGVPGHGCGDRAGLALENRPQVLASVAEPQDGTLWLNTITGEVRLRRDTGGQS